MQGVTANEHIDWTNATQDFVTTGTITAANFTGDTTSIVGITGTKSEFDTACTDGDFVYGGGTATGVNTGDQTITLTGDVTGSGTGSFAATLSSSVITGKSNLTTFETTDEILIYDDSATTLKAVTFGDLVSGLELAVSHDNLADFSTLEHINWTNATQDFETSGTVTAGTLSIPGVSIFASGFASDDNDYLIFSGGDSTATGANIVLYGTDTSVTNPYDVLVRSNTTTQLQFDYSASEWNFQANDITTVGDISGAAITASGNISAANFFDWRNDQGATNIHVNNVPEFTTSTSGTVPASGGSASDFLAADGNWTTLSVNKFQSVVIDDGDTGYSWSAIGTLTPTSQTESLTFVSGEGVDIDADSSNQAIRFSTIDWTVDQGSTNILPANIELFATDSTTSGTVPGSNSVGATYFLNASGAWSVPEGGTNSPLTTKGDLYTYDTDNQRLPIGTNTHVLTADDTQATGMKWAAAPGGDSFKTQTVTDTDSGYTWTETGSAVAGSATDTITWVSGSNVDIDVDATSKAIRISSTGAQGSSDSFYTHTVDDGDTGYTWSETGSVVASSGTDTLTWVSGEGIDLDVDSTSKAIRIRNTGGGGGGDAFGTVTIDDGDTGYTWAETGSAVAETSADTLTMVSGEGIDIDVDAASDAIRINTIDWTVDQGTFTQINTANIPEFTDSAPGLVPAANTSSPSTDYLRADGTWSTVAASGMHLDIPTASGTYDGITITGYAGENLVFGDLCYRENTSSTNIEMKKANATSSTLMNCVAIAVETINSGNTGKFLLMGTIEYSGWSFSYTTFGTGVFVAAGSYGDLTTSNPNTADDIVQKVGWVLTYNTIFFNPSNEGYLLN